jgi:guanosine-3',5'-bis(diphosphate) 3'-pyrophosphohydrolase
MQARAKPKNEEGWFGLKRGSGMKFRVPGLSRRPVISERAAKKAGAPIPIRGLNGESAVRFAEGGAVPGDRIVGIMSPGEGITIYPIESQALKAFDEQPERWLDVRWDVDDATPSRFRVRLEVTELNEPGSLAQVAQVIGDGDANIAVIHTLTTAADFSVLQIDVEVFDVKHLNRLIAKLKSLPVVSSVARVSV